ncbi:ferritin-like protein [Limnoraphis robusta]|uniref:Ferritin-like protein n=1 Tax=Limnoraphis robusta CCNP1315 TaxID=3110306 RepID=A0ABU5U3J2_9CYAN|nr:ferritin-like protein [Limnoraphis robusta]MEA5521689.1 ferritin-like protein [Limnoraphis robusta CCNP1315]MEA5547071.1 ferritin-like protein [Limnoraphis robusta CCNP1324]
MTDRLRLIKTIEDLHYYLIHGMMIEHATFPPYITALYSLKPGSNQEAFHIIRAVAVEEMLHLTLVANVFNAVGGDWSKGVLTADSFIPDYPTPLPTGATDFEVHLRKFSPETVEMFMNIERSHEVADDAPLVRPRNEPQWLRILGLDPTKTYHSIGLFYAEVIRGMQELDREYKSQGKNLFCGDPKKQVTPEYYYDGAGEIIPVTDLRSAIRALRVIQEQGEGSRHEAIYDAERELSHYYRFQQLKLGQYYVIDKENPLNSDHPNQPTGQTFNVDWDAVYPVLEDAKLSDYPEGSEVYTHAQQFQKAYRDFLAQIQFAFNGHPEKLLPAIAGMFRLKESATQLIRNPIPGKEGVNAAPIY